MLIAQVQIQSNSLLEYIVLVLSVVSLVVTVLGFLASLKFYRDGTQLQAKANDALTKIEEKTQFIQTQVGGMFDKTLEAAIGKRELMSASFEEIDKQLEETKTKIIEESIKEIGVAGEKERQRLTGIVDREIALVKNKVESTRESAVEIVDDSTRASMHRDNMRLLRFIIEVIGKENRVNYKFIRDATRLDVKEIDNLLTSLVNDDYINMSLDGYISLRPRAQALRRD